jgi:hypothetical protein
LRTQSQSKESPVVSKKNYAKKVIEDLVRKRKDTKFCGCNGETIFFEDYRPSADETQDIEPAEIAEESHQKKPSDKQLEIKYVRSIRPYFQQIFSQNHLEVIDSQAFPWLIDPLGAPNRPDLFLAPQWAYMTRITAENPIALHCGVVPSTKLYNSVYLFDCKLRMNEEALGELFLHLQLLNYSATNPTQISKGMLFGPEGCYLCTCEGQDMIGVERCSSGTPGLVNHLQEFFPPFPYQAKLSSVLSDLQLEIVEPSIDRETSFLGAGAYGQVFKVKRFPEFNDDNLYALKIVNSHYDRICREFFILDLHTKCECSCNLIASVPDFSSLTTVDSYHSFVMSPVGIGLKREDFTSKKLYGEAINLLRSLHVHRPPILHGDARYANIVKRSNDSLFWIDFAAVFPLNLAREHLQVGFMMDMQSLVESFTDIRIPHELLAAYSQSPVLETKPIIDFLWQSTKSDLLQSTLEKNMSKMNLACWLDQE